MPYKESLFFYFMIVLKRQSLNDFHFSLEWKTIIILVHMPPLLIASMMFEFKSFIVCVKSKETMHACNCVWCWMNIGNLQWKGQHERSGVDVCENNETVVVSAIQPFYKSLTKSLAHYKYSILVLTTSSQRFLEFYEEKATFFSWLWAPHHTISSPAYHDFQMSVRYSAAAMATIVSYNPSV